MAGEPMSNEQFHVVINWLAAGHQVPTPSQVAAIMRALDEVERLRAREAAALEVLPRFLYPFTAPYTCDPCPWCHCSQDYEPHDSDCPVTMARTVLQQQKGA